MESNIKVYADKELAQLGAKLILESVRKEASMGAYERLLANDTDIQTMLKKQIVDLVTKQFSAIVDLTNHRVEVTNYANVTIYKVVKETRKTTHLQKTIEFTLTKLFDKVPYDFLVGDKKLSKQRLSEFEVVASRIYEAGY